MAEIGRPPTYSDPTQLAAQCEAYFAEVESEGEKPLVTGLAYFLGFSDKSSLYDYRDKPEFFHPIKRALLKIEMMHERSLQGQNVTGPIFALKNMGWKDTQRNEITGADGSPLSIQWVEEKTYDNLETK